MVLTLEDEDTKLSTMRINEVTQKINHFFFTFNIFKALLLLSLPCAIHSKQ